MGRQIDRMRDRLRSPVVQFTLAGMTAVLTVGLIAAFFLHQAGTEEAIRTAKKVASLTGEGIVEPAVTSELLDGDPAALARVDEVVRDRVLGREGIIRVKIWGEDSQIVYSDEPRLIGERFELGEDELEILQGGGTEAETTDLSEPENRFETSDADLLEVYLPIRTPSGEPLLFEIYVESSFVASAGDRVWSTLAPTLIAALILLAMLQLPLAISLSRRLRHGQEERETLLTRAIDASEMERRRIARDLHDGVVQDLAGVSFSLEASAKRSETGVAADADSLREAARCLRQSVRDLRGLLVEIYPPDLHRVGLAAALTDIVGGCNARGLKTTLEIPEDLEISDESEGLLFRIIQEALRNVTAHADADHVEIHIGAANGTVSLQIRDDGRGFSPEEARNTKGHFGLRMLEELTRERGGHLEVVSSPGHGATIQAEVPAR